MNDDEQGKGDEGISNVCDDAKTRRSLRKRETTIKRTRGLVGRILMMMRIKGMMTDTKFV